MPTIYQLEKKLSRAFPEEQAQLLAEAIHDSYDELVKVSDFRELKSIVASISVHVGELAEQQKVTGIRIDGLARRIDGLAQRMDELAEQEKITGKRIDGLAQRMDELAEQEKITSRRMDELAEQEKITGKRVDNLAQRMDELAVQQKETAAEVRILAQGMQQVRKELGRISTTVGYRLEDESYQALPRLLLRDFDLQVQGKLKRGYLSDKEGNPLEINILGEAERRGERFLIIGEAKSQLSRKYVDEFRRKKLQRLSTTQPLTLFPLLVTYMVTAPEVEQYVREQRLALYYSFEFFED
jgi:DNA repair ATPase RecN